MSLDERTDDAVFRNLITWNVPAIRRSGNEDAIAFLETLQLNARRFGEDDAEAVSSRMLPMRRAALGLRAELSGDKSVALEHYKKVARLPGLRGVLGHLLIAWMQDATPEMFKRVEKRLDQLAGPGSKDLVARCHCRLAGWALDHGWRETAEHHFEQARRFAGKELRFQLDEIAHWFGQQRRIYFKAKSAPMVRFSWIIDFVDDAARKSVEDRFKESFKSPWQRTWTIGATSVEGTNIQAAEMQASWAGALWLMPTIYRQHAALILGQSSDTADISRAVALWVRGGGKNARQLVEAYEGHLTEESVADLLITKLHSGRSVTDAATWLETCHALWSEMPQSLVNEILDAYAGPPQGIHEHGEPASELSLVAKLLARSKSPNRKLATFDDAQLALLLRVAPRRLVDSLDEGLLRRGLKAALEESGDDWKSRGWAALAHAWSRLPAKERAELRGHFIESIPPQQVATAAAMADGLFPLDVLESQLEHEIEVARRDISNAAKGMFSRSSIEPSANIAWLTHLIGSVGEPVQDVLRALATDNRIEAFARQAALEALTFLAREHSLDQNLLTVAFWPVESVAWAHMSDDAPADQRYENLQREALRLSFGYDSAADSQLLSGSRDPSTRVRHLAVETAAWLSLQGAESPALDAALLGALYDPHPSVQAAAIPALWRGTFSSPVLREASKDRVVELWPTAPLQLRLAIAREAANSAGIHDEQLGALAYRCRQDRSVAVRWALAGAAT